MHFVTKSLIALAIAAVIAPISFLYVAEKGVPFIEGDRTTTEGEAEGFRIGMSKAEAFDALRLHYSDRSARIAHVWERSSSPTVNLSPFETPESRRRTSSEYGIYEAPVDSLETIPLPLVVGERWDVKLPSSWVHSVYVTFESNEIVSIRHSRWLFER